MGWLSYRNSMGVVRSSGLSPNFNAPLDSSLILKRGSATPTFSRSTTATVTDFEGAVHTAKIDESRFEGARRVENFIRFSEDISNSTWYTTTSNGQVISSDTFRATQQFSSVIQSFTVTIGSTYIFSFYAKNIDGNNDMHIKIQGNGGVNTPITLSDTELQRFEVSFTPTSTGSPEFGLQDRNASGFGDSIFTNIQIEQVTGTQTEASEYVSTDVGEILGSEIVTNGGFDTDSDWDKSAQTTISGGQATIASNDGSFQSIRQSGLGYENTEGKMVKITLDIISTTGNGIKVSFSGGTTNTNITNTVGTHTVIVPNDGTIGEFVIGRISGVMSCTIDNVSVKETFFHGAGVDGVKYFNTDRSDVKISDSTLKGYLAEGQRTNLLLSSEEFDNAIWTKRNGHVITADQTLSPDGSMTADLVTVTGFVDTNEGIFQQQGGNNENTVSVWLKAGTISSVRIILKNRDSDDIKISSNETITSSWQRFDITGTNDGVSPGARVEIQGNSNGTFFIWGAQLEESSFPTSYIETTTTQVTKTIDNLFYGADDIKQGEGSIVCEFNQLGVNSGEFPRIVALSDGSSNNRILIDGIQIQKADWIWSDSGVIQANFNAGNDSYTYNISSIIGASYKLNDVNGFLDGTLEGSDTSVTIPDFNKISIGMDAVGSSQINGNVKNVKIFKKKLSDTKMESLTS